MFLEREPANRYDPNAIKVMGSATIDGQLLTRELGYVPKEDAKRLRGREIDVRPDTVNLPCEGETYKLTVKILVRSQAYKKKHQIPCANCGAKFRADEKYAGRWAKCRGCGAPMQIPELVEHDTPVGEPASWEHPPRFPESSRPVKSDTLRVISLQSGSNGNCIYVEAGGVKLLFDAGISGIQVKKRLALYRRDVASVDAVLISHDHDDHARKMGVYHRKFGLPIYVTAKTYRAATKYGLGDIKNINHFSAGESLRFGKVVVQTIRTPHDAEDGLVFVVDDGKHRLGVLTDLGHVFSELAAVIGSLDAVLLESNYDAHMLANGPYPDWLKKRVEGPGGHLSNKEAAHLLRVAAPKRMKWACLAHLSQNNNTADLALETHRRILGKWLPLFVATRYKPTAVLEL